jgi:hypothetical protein
MQKKQTPLDDLNPFPGITQFIESTIASLENKRKKGFVVPSSSVNFNSWNFVFSFDSLTFLQRLTAAL